MAKEVNENGIPFSDPNPSFSPSTPNPSWNQVIPADKNFKAYEKMITSRGRMNAIPAGYTNLEHLAAKYQTNWERNIAFVPRMLSTAVTEIVRFPFNVTSAGAGLIAAPFSDDSVGESLADYIDNPLTNFLYALEEDMKAATPVFKREGYNQGSFLDEITKSEFVGEELAQGVGFWLGNIIPVIASRGSSLRLIGARKAPMFYTKAAISKSNSAISRALNAPALRLGPNALENVNLGVWTMAQSISEASAETKFAMNTLREEFDQKIHERQINPKTGQPYTEADFQAVKGDLAQSIFFKNIGLLSFTNFFMNKMLLGKGPDKDIMMRMVKESTAKSSRWNNTFRALSKVGEGILNEGFLEEGLQTAFEQADVERALKTGTVDFWESLGSVPAAYSNMMGTMEGKKAVFIGGLLGGAGSIKAAYKTATGKEEKSALDSMRENAGTTLKALSKAGAEVFEFTSDGKNVRFDDQGRPVIKTTVDAAMRESIQNSFLAMAFALQNRINDPNLSEEKRLLSQQALSKLITNELNSMLLPYAIHGTAGVAAFEADFGTLSQTIKDTLVSESFPEAMFETPRKDELVKRIGEMQKGLARAKAISTELFYEGSIYNHKDAKNEDFQTALETYLSEITEGWALAYGRIEAHKNTIKNAQSAYDALDENDPQRPLAKAVLDANKKQYDADVKLVKEAERKNGKALYKDFEKFRAGDFVIRKRINDFIKAVEENVIKNKKVNKVFGDNVAHLTVTVNGKNVTRNVSSIVQLQNPQTGETSPQLTFDRDLKEVAKGTLLMHGEDGKIYVMHQDNDTFSLYEQGGRDPIIKDASLVVLKDAKSVAEESYQEVLLDMTETVDNMVNLINAALNQLHANIKQYEKEKKAVSGNITKTTPASKITSYTNSLALLDSAINQTQLKIEELNTVLKSIDKQALFQKAYDNLITSEHNELIQAILAKTKKSLFILNEKYFKIDVTDKDFDDVSEYPKLIDQMMKKADEMLANSPDSEEAKDIKKALSEIKEHFDETVASVANDASSFADNAKALAADIRAIYSNLLMHASRVYVNMDASMSYVDAFSFDKSMKEAYTSETTQTGPVHTYVANDGGMFPADRLGTDFVDWTSYLKVNYNNADFEKAVAARLQGAPLTDHDKAILVLHDFLYNGIGARKNEKKRITNIKNVQAFAVTIESIQQLLDSDKVKKGSLTQSMLESVTFFAGDAVGHINTKTYREQHSGSKVGNIARKSAVMVFFEVDGTKLIPIVRDGVLVHSTMSGTAEMGVSTGTNFSKFTESSLAVAKQEYEGPDGKKTSAFQIASETYADFRTKINTAPAQLSFSQLHQGFPTSGFSMMPLGMVVEDNPVYTIELAAQPRSIAKNEKGQMTFTTKDGKFTYDSLPGLAHINVNGSLFPIFYPKLIDSDFFRNEITNLFVYIAHQSRLLFDENGQPIQNLASDVHSNIIKAYEQINQYTQIKFKADDFSYALALTGNYELLIGNTIFQLTDSTIPIETLRTEIANAIMLNIPEKYISFNKEYTGLFSKEYKYYTVNYDTSGAPQLQAVLYRGQYEDFLMENAAFQVKAVSGHINRSISMKLVGEMEDFHDKISDELKKQKAPEPTNQAQRLPVGMYNIQLQAKPGALSEKVKEIRTEILGGSDSAVVTFEIVEGAVKSGNKTLNLFITDALSENPNASELKNELTKALSLYGITVNTMESQASGDVDNAGVVGDLLTLWDKYLATYGSEFPIPDDMNPTEYYEVIKQSYEQVTDEDSRSEASFIDFLDEMRGVNMKIDPKVTTFETISIPEQQAVVDKLFTGVVVEGRKLPPHIAGQVITGMRILLNNHASATGVVYHEAYHIASLYFLTDKERTAIYEEYKKKTGKTDLSPREIEELLAEEFRMYMLTGRKDSPIFDKSPKKKGWFQRLIDAIRKILGLGTSKSIDEFFTDIANGKYKTRNPKTTVLNHPYNMEIPGMNANAVVPALTALDNKMLTQMFIDIKTGKVNAKALLNFNFTDSVYTAMVRDIAIEFNMAKARKNENSFIHAFFDGDVDNFNEAWYDLKEEHKARLKTLGFTIREDEDYNEEYEAGDIEGFIAKQRMNNPNPIRDLNPPVKMLLLLLYTDRKTVGQYNYYTSDAVNATASLVTNLLQNVSMDQMFTMFRRLAPDVPQMGLLYKLLDGDNPQVTDPDMIILRNTFFKSLKKTKIAVATFSDVPVFSGNEGQIDDRIIDHYYENLIRNKERDWVNRVGNFNSGIFSKDDNGIDISKPFVKFNGASLTISDVLNYIDTSPNMGVRPKAELLMAVFEGLAMKFTIGTSKKAAITLLTSANTAELEFVFLEMIRLLAYISGDLRSRYTSTSVIPISALKNDVSFLPKLRVLFQMHAYLDYGASTSYNVHGKLMNLMRYSQPLSDTFSALQNISALSKSADMTAANQVAHDFNFVPYDTATKTGSTHVMGSKLLELALVGKLTIRSMKQIKFSETVRDKTVPIGKITSSSEIFTIHSDALFQGMFVPLKTSDRDNLWAIDMREFFNERSESSVMSNFSSYLRQYMESNFMSMAVHEEYKRTVKKTGKGKAKNAPSKIYKAYSKTPSTQKFLIQQLLRFLMQDPVANRALISALEIDPNKPVSTRAAELRVMFLENTALFEQFTEFLIITLKSDLRVQIPALRTPHSVTSAKAILNYRRNVMNIYTETDNSYDVERTLEEALNVYIMRGLICSVETSKLFFTDEAFFGKEISAIKRINGLDSTTYTPATGNAVNDQLTRVFPTINQKLGVQQATTDDVQIAVTPDSHIFLNDDFVELLEKAGVKESYKLDKEGTDGESAITPDLYRRIMLQHGEWGDSKERWYQFVMQSYFLQLIEINKSLPADSKNHLKLHERPIDNKLFVELFGEHLRNGEFSPIPMFKGQPISRSSFNTLAVKPLKTKGFATKIIHGTTIIDYDKHELVAEIPSESFVEPSAFHDQLYMMQPYKFYKLLHMLNAQVEAEIHPSAIKIDHYEEPASRTLKIDPNNPYMYFDNRMIKSFAIQVGEPTEPHTNTTSSKQLNNMFAIDLVGSMYVAGKVVDKRDNPDRAEINAVFQEFYQLTTGLVYNKVLSEYDKLGIIFPKNTRIQDMHTKNLDEADFELDLDRFEKRLSEFMDTAYISTNEYDEVKAVIQEYRKTLEANPDFPKNTFSIKLLSSNKQITSSILSIVKKAGISPKIFGMYAPQVSAGYGNKNSSEIITAHLVDGKKGQLMEDTGGDLKMFEYEVVDGVRTGKILGIQVKAPLPDKYKGWVLHTFKTKGRTTEEAYMAFRAEMRKAAKTGKSDIIPREMLEGYVVRVPLDNRHQSAHVRIVDYFLPGEGFKIMVPTGFLDMSGSDFDYDKLHIYMYNPIQNYATGKLEFHRYNKQSVISPENVAIRAANLMSSEKDMYQVLGQISNISDIAENTVNEFRELFVLAESAEIRKEMTADIISEILVEIGKPELSGKKFLDDYQRLVKRRKALSYEHAQNKTNGVYAKNHALQVQNRARLEKMKDQEWSMTAVIAGAAETGIYAGDVYEKMEEAFEAKKQVQKSLEKILLDYAAYLNSTSFALTAEIENRMLDLRIDLLKNNEDVALATVVPTSIDYVLDTTGNKTPVALDFMKDAQAIGLQYLYSPASYAQSFSEVNGFNSLIGIVAKLNVNHAKSQYNTTKADLNRITIPFSVTGSSIANTKEYTASKTFDGWITNTENRAISTDIGSLLTMALDFLNNIHVKNLPFNMHTINLVALLLQYSSTGFKGNPLALNDILSILVSRSGRLATMNIAYRNTTLLDMGISPKIIIDFYKQMIEHDNVPTFYDFTRKIRREINAREMTVGNLLQWIQYKTYIKLDSASKNLIMKKGGNLKDITLVGTIASKYARRKFSQADVESDFEQSQLAEIELLKSLFKPTTSDVIPAIPIDFFTGAKQRTTAGMTDVEIIEELLKEIMSTGGSTFDLNLKRTAFVTDLLAKLQYASKQTFDHHDINSTESKTNITTFSDLLAFIGKYNSLTMSKEEALNLSRSLGAKVPFGSTDVVNNTAKAISTSRDIGYINIMLTTYAVIKSMNNSIFFSENLNRFVTNLMTDAKYFDGDPEIVNYDVDKVLAFGTALTRMKINDIDIFELYKQYTDPTTSNNTVFAAFSNIPKDIVKNSKVLSALSPRSYILTAIGSSKTDIGFDVDSSVYMEDSLGYYQDFEHLRLAYSDNKNVQIVLDFLLIEALFEIAAGSKKVYQNLVDLSELQNIVMTAFTVNNSIKKIGDVPYDAYSQTNANLDRAMDNFIINNYYNLVDKYDTDTVFRNDEVEVSIDSLNFDYRDYGNDLFDGFGKTQNSPLIFSRLMSFSPNARMKADDGETFKKYISISMPLFELIGLSKQQVAKLDGAVHENPIYAAYVNGLKAQLFRKRVNVIYKLDENATNGSYRYNFLMSPQFMNNKTKYIRNDAHAQVVHDEFVASVMFMRAVYKEVVNGRFPAQLFETSIEHENPMVEKAILDNDKLIMREFLSEVRKAHPLLADMLESIPAFDLMADLMAEYEGKLPTPGFFSQLMESSAYEKTKLGKELSEDAVKKMFKSYNSANFHEAKKVSQNINRSDFVNDIVKNWESYFPNLTHYNEPQRIFIAEQIDDNNVQLKCKI